MRVIPLAVQLYSVRDAADRALGEALDRLVACGYGAVEPFTAHGLSMSAFGRELRERGLSVVAVHQSLDHPAALDATLDGLAAWGARRVVIPWTDPRALVTLDDVERLAERLNRLREVLDRWQLELGYHNHAWEFSTCAGGRTLHEQLFARLH